MKLTITETNGMVSVESKPKCDLDAIFQLCFTAILGSMNQIKNNQTSEEAKLECTKALYDHLNIAASRTLEAFAPELELRPNLTAQAILEAENRIIEEGRLSEVAEGT